MLNIKIQYFDHMSLVFVIPNTPCTKFKPYFVIYYPFLDNVVDKLLVKAKLSISLEKIKTIKPYVSVI